MLVAAKWAVSSGRKLSFVAGPEADRRLCVGCGAKRAIKCAIYTLMSNHWTRTHLGGQFKIYYKQYITPALQLLLPLLAYSHLGQHLPSSLVVGSRRSSSSSSSGAHLRLAVARRCLAILLSVSFNQLAVVLLVVWGSFCGSFCGLAFSRAILCHFGVEWRPNLRNTRCFSKEFSQICAHSKDVRTSLNLRCGGSRAEANPQLQVRPEEIARPEGSMPVCIEPKLIIPKQGRFLCRPQSISLTRQGALKLRRSFRLHDRRAHYLHTNKAPLEMEWNLLPEPRERDHCFWWAAI